MLFRNRIDPGPFQKEIEALWNRSLTNNSEVNKKTKGMKISIVLGAGNGDGPFFDFVAQPNNVNETNVSNPYQGSFRISPFFFPNLVYAITSDLVYNHRFDVNRRIVVTCMDQFEDKIPVIKDDLSGIIELNKDEFVDRLFLPDRILVDRPDF